MNFSDEREAVKFLERMSYVVMNGQVMAPLGTGSYPPEPDADETDAINYLAFEFGYIYVK